MREYGDPPSPNLIVATAVVAFTDGRVEPVTAYWLEGELFAYVNNRDVVTRVGRQTVDVLRSQKLNRSQGVVFKIP